MEREENRSPTSSSRSRSLSSETEKPAEKKQQHPGRPKLWMTKILKAVPGLHLFEGQEIYVTGSASRNRFSSFSIKSLIVVALAVAILLSFSVLKFLEIGRVPKQSTSYRPDFNAKVPNSTYPLEKVLPFMVQGAIQPYEMRNTSLYEELKITDPPDAESYRQLLRETSVFELVSFLPSLEICFLVYSVEFISEDYFLTMPDYAHPKTNCTVREEILVGSSRMLTLTQVCYFTIHPIMNDAIVELQLHPLYMTFKHKDTSLRWIIGADPSKFSMQEKMDFWNEFYGTGIQYQKLPPANVIDFLQTEDNIYMSYDMIVKHTIGFVPEDASWSEKAIALIKNCFTFWESKESKTDLQQQGSMGPLNNLRWLQFKTKVVSTLKFPPKAILRVEYYTLVDFLSQLGGLQSIVALVTTSIIGFYIFAEFNRSMAKRLFELQHPEGFEEGAADAKKAALKTVEEDFRRKVTQESICLLHDKVAYLESELMSVKARERSLELRISNLTNSGKDIPPSLSVHQAKMRLAALYEQLRLAMNRQSFSKQSNQ